MEVKILKTLLKRATGYSHNEVQEEYSVREDGEIVLTKRKITRKYYPPDSSALRAYLELKGGGALTQMSDEELEREKERLLKELKQEVENEKNKNKKNAKE